MSGLPRAHLTVLSLHPDDATGPVECTYSGCEDVVRWMFVMADGAGLATHHTCDDHAPTAASELILGAVNS